MKVDERFITRTGHGTVGVKMFFSVEEIHFMSMTAHMALEEMLTNAAVDKSDEKAIEKIKQSNPVVHLLGKIASNLNEQLSPNGVFEDLH